MSIRAALRVRRRSRCVLLCARLPACLLACLSTPLSAQNERTLSHTYAYTHVLPCCSPPPFPPARGPGQDACKMEACTSPDGNQGFDCWASVRERERARERACVQERERARERVCLSVFATSPTSLLPPPPSLLPLSLSVLLFSFFRHRHPGACLAVTCKSDPKP